MSEASLKIGSEMSPVIEVGGLEKLSMVDWPGQLVAVVFCQGCLWRCRYCHNSHLRPWNRWANPDANGGAPSWTEVLRWLEGRRGLLDGVVFSGGEPSLQPGLLLALQAVRALGFKTGLHTAGPSPEHLARLLPYLDWVGFDVKAPFDAYANITGVEQGTRVRESLNLLRTSRVACEIRTTWHPQLLSEGDLAKIGQTLATEGWREWVIQRFRAKGSADFELAAALIGQVPVPGVPGLRISVRE